MRIWERPGELMHAKTAKLATSHFRTSDVHLAQRLTRQGARATRFADSIVITIDDRAPGVDPTEVERIFEPFYRRAGVLKQNRGTY